MLISYLVTDYGKAVQLRSRTCASCPRPQSSTTTNTNTLFHHLIISSQRRDSPFQDHVSSSTCEMNDQFRFYALFDSAFQDYKRVTGYDLFDNVLNSRFEDCHSVESVVALIQLQMEPVGGSQLGDGAGAGDAIRIKKSLEGAVSVLYTLSTSTVLRNEVTGLV